MDNATSSETAVSNRSFDWAIYADATLAGLSILIPIPFVDTLSERFFRTRMLPSIAGRRKLQLDPRAVATVNRLHSGVWSWVGGCLFLPLHFLLDLVLRLSRKILYFLTVKNAIDALNYYWQRAFLLDYMARQGYLDSAEQAEPATAALEQVLADHSTSPLTRLAREIVLSPRRLIQAVRRARQGQDDVEIEQTRRRMSAVWNCYGGYLQRLLDQYEAAYQAHRIAHTVGE